MTREEAVKEIKKAFEPAFANYIIIALTEGATVSDKEPTTKNDLGVDAVSRQAVLDKKELVELEDGQSFYCINPEDVETLPSVTPQEPMVEIDLYSVIKQKYIEREVLDKIRAEIEHLTYYWCEVNPRTVIDDVLQIIGKYKAESEGEE